MQFVDGVFMKITFPANSVINSFNTTEKMLVDVVNVVPYCDGHRDVWSPVLVTIILEACSQLDSLWKYDAKQSSYVTKDRLSIRDYFVYYGEYMAPKWLVFYGEVPEKIQPFESWGKIPSSADYQELEWWAAYNKVKHNRLKNRTSATLKHAVYALAGLFTAILRCELCRSAIEQADWLLGDGYNLKASLGEDSPSTKLKYITAESKLFTYPVGWSDESIDSATEWKGACSFRFRHWLEVYKSTL